MSVPVMPPGDPGLLEELADALDRHSAKVTDVGGTTSVVTAQVPTDAEWTGQAADAYTQFTGEFCGRIRQAAPPLTQIAAAVRGYAGALRTAQQQATAYNYIVENLQATGAPPTEYQLQAAYRAQDSANQAYASWQAAGGYAAGQVKSAAAELDALSSPGADGVKDKDSPFRVASERVHAALDASGMDGILWILGKNAALAEKFMKELPQQEEDWLLEQMRDDVARKLANPETDVDEGSADTTSRWFTMYDAAEGFGEQFERDTKVLGLLSRTGRLVGGPAGLYGDVLTIIHPAQSGGIGLADRGVAGVNSYFVGTDTAGALGEALGVEALGDLSLGPIGAGIAVGTGLYLAGSYAYEHYAWFRNDFAKPVGHVVADNAKALYHYGVVDLTHLFGL